jgi:ligand-binding SRPBCC domain-containing protein
VPTLTFQTVLPAPIELVWDYHQNVHKALPALSPPEADVRIETADLPLKIGSRVTLTANAPLGPFRRRIRWVARYTDFRPPKSVVFGEEARWTDEQESGPFAYWKHQHEFEAVDSASTRVVDHVTYRPPLGPLGLLLDPLLIRPKLHRLFAHRHSALAATFAALAARPAAP